MAGGFRLYMVRDITSLQEQSGTLSGPFEVGTPGDSHNDVDLLTNTFSSQMSSKRNLKLLLRGSGSLDGWAFLEAHGSLVLELPLLWQSVLVHPQKTCRQCQAKWGFGWSRFLLTKTFSFAVAVLEVPQRAKISWRRLSSSFPTWLFIIDCSAMLTFEGEIKAESWTQRTPWHSCWSPAGQYHLWRCRSYYSALSPPPEPPCSNLLENDQLFSNLTSSASAFVVSSLSSIRARASVNL